MRAPENYKNVGEGRDSKTTTVQPQLGVLPSKLLWFPLNPLEQSTVFYKTAELEACIYNMFQLERLIYYVIILGTAIHM